MTPEPRAALLIAGLRSFAPPVALGLIGRGPLTGAARFLALGAAAGERVADTQPERGSCPARRSMTLRMGFSASAGSGLVLAAGRSITA